MLFVNLLIYYNIIENISLVIIIKININNLKLEKYLSSLLIKIDLKVLFVLRNFSYLYFIYISYLVLEDFLFMILKIIEKYKISYIKFYN